MLALLVLISCVQLVNGECSPLRLNDIRVVITPEQVTYDVGAVVDFSCYDGGDVLGPTSSSCQEDGSWDYTSKPICNYCNRPNLLNPYAVHLSPDQETYLVDEDVNIGCEEAHASYTLPLIFHCQFSRGWHPDPSGHICLAQCDTRQLLDSDVTAKNPVTDSPQTVFSPGERAIFSCQSTHQFTGQDSATCNNGSFHFDSQPECLGPCLIFPDRSLESGLSYTVVGEMVINETHTLHYSDGAMIGFTCTDGYTPDHCHAVCRDGSWDPRDFPACIAIDGLSTGAIVGLSILTILLVASVIINAGFFFFLKRSRTKEDADKEPSSYRITTNGNNSGINRERSERIYTSLRFGQNKSTSIDSAGKRVTFLTKLGSHGLGEFGEAWKGVRRSTQETVFIRRVSDDSVKAKKLLARVKAFSQLGDHPNIVKYLGYHSDQNITLYEFISGGTLLTHLQMKRGQAQPTYMAYNIKEPQQASVDEVGLINFALQIAKGIRFLASKKIVHGSLCAHNVLLDEQQICKVSDYGIAQTMFDKGIKTSRWNSPETISEGVLSSESDVWSFGIVLWEIMSLGGRPYPHLELDGIGKEITDGYKMPRPTHCRNELYTIMSRCWERKRGNRIKIDEIVTNLDQILVQTQGSLNYLLLNDLDNDAYHAYASVY